MFPGGDTKFRGHNWLDRRHDAHHRSQSKDFGSTGNCRRVFYFLGAIQGGTSLSRLPGKCIGLGWNFIGRGTRLTEQIARQYRFELSYSSGGSGVGSVSGRSVAHLIAEII